MNTGMIGTSKRIALGLAAWIIGLMILFLALPLMTISRSAGVILLVAAGLVLPPGRWGTKRLFGRLPSVKATGWIVALLVVGGIATALPAVERTAEADRAAKAARELDDQKARLDAAKIEIRSLVSAGRWDEALRAIGTFTRISDPELAALGETAAKGREATRREARKSDLLAQLKTTGPDALDDLADIRRELADLDPTDGSHARIAAELTEKLRERTKREVAAERERAAKAAAEAEMRRKYAEGLVWRWSSSRDPMSDGTILSNWVRSSDTFSFGFPYGGAQRATLEIRTHPRWGRAVLLSVERGQFACGAPDDCEARIRFDDGPVQGWRLGTPSDHASDTRFVLDHTRFVRAVSRSKKVRVEVGFFQEGTRTFEFETVGYE